MTHHHDSMKEETDAATATRATAIGATARGPYSEGTIAIVKVSIIADDARRRNKQQQDGSLFNGLRQLGRQLGLTLRMTQRSTASLIEQSTSLIERSTSLI
jgi:hypothetical protein